MIRRLLAASVFLVVLAIFAGGIAAWFETRNFAAPGRAAEAVQVIIAPGTPLPRIAAELEAAGVVDNALLFRIGVIRRNAATLLKAGEYEFPAGASMAVVLDMLVNHRAILHRITIAEGLTSAMVLDVLRADPVLTGDLGEAPPEGSLLPETYLFERGATRAELLARMRASQESVLAGLWPARRADLPFGTMEEAIILASIVEKETAIAAERPRIAAVFVNRLKRGMRLESDPTIIYGLTGGAPLGRGLRVSELERPNPYSTYQIDGLPPTPICNPGRDSIAAVLNPPDSDDLFFVADGGGGHAFARTLAEHERNVAAWRRVERARAAAP